MIPRQFVLAGTCYGELVTKDRQSSRHLCSHFCWIDKVCGTSNLAFSSTLFTFRFASHPFFFVLLVVHWPIYLSLSLIDIIKIIISHQVGPILRSHHWWDMNGLVKCSMFGHIKHVNNCDDKVFFALMDYMLEMCGGPRSTFDRKMKASSITPSTALLHIYYRYSHFVFILFY